MTWDAAMEAERPKLLDLFSCAGGAAMGYHRAGFDVVGVDIEPQPRYPFEHHVGDALEYLAEHGHEFDAIHASPPCQLYSVANHIHGSDEHPDLLPATRSALNELGKPYVIENVPGSPMENYVTLCGLSFGLGVKRHRWFETSFFVWGVPECPAGHPGDWVSVFGDTTVSRGHVIGRAKGGGPTIARKHLGLERGRAAMGIDWMNRHELSEAIPPAYTEFIGRQMIQALVPIHTDGSTT